MKNFFRRIQERELNFIGIVLLCICMGVGFFMEFGMGEIPCKLCFLQRICMMGLGFSLYLNLLLGIQPRHYGFALIWALLGVSCALRQIALCICKPVAQDALLFASHRMPTWSFLIFFFSIFGISLLLCLNKKAELFPLKPKKGPMFYAAVGLLLSMLTIGFVSILMRKGFSF
jgi:disulfide bond formation protein DsbB